MKIVIEKGNEGGFFEITRAPDFSEMSGGAKKFRDDRTNNYLCFKKDLRSIRPLIIEIQLSEV